MAAGAAACVCLLATVASGTRAALLGLLAGLFVLLLFAPPARLRRSVAGALALTLSLSLAAAIFLFSEPGQRLRNRFTRGADERIGATRLGLWQGSLAMAFERPVIGYGPENFGREFPRFQSLPLAQAYPDSFHESPHNILLDAWIEYGMPGAILLLLVTGAALSAAWRVRGREPVLAASFAAALAAAFVAQQFMAFTVATALYFFVNVALMTALSGRPAAAIRSSKITTTVKCGCIAVWVWLAVQLAVFDHQLQLSNDQLERRDIPAAIATYDRSMRWEPPGVTADLWFSRQLFAAGWQLPNPEKRQLSWRRSIAAGERAVLRADERANSFFHLAMLWGVADDLPRCENHLRAAIHAAPNWYLPHWTLAKLLARSGRADESARHKTAALRIKPVIQ
jgi:hypothetical protein